MNQHCKLGVNNSVVLKICKTWGTKIKIKKLKTQMKVRQTLKLKFVFFYMCI